MEATVASHGDSISESIERDLAQAREKLAKLQDEDAAWGPAHITLVEVEEKIWDKILGELGVEYMDDVPSEVMSELTAAQRTVDNSRKREAGIMANIAHTKRKIAQLEDPSESDRRVEVKERTTEARRRSNMAKETAKDQGVPDAYLNAETGNFKVGMDARYKSDLVNSALGVEGVGMLSKFEPKDAEARLAKRGWEEFLDRKRQIIAEKEAKAAESAAAKEAAAREKADAKKAAQAERAAAKAEKQTLAQAAAAEGNPARGDSSEVKADPKVGARRK